MDSGRCCGRSTDSVPLAALVVSGRRFNLVRSVDVSGVSGVGTVAYGCTFPDGKTVMWWNTGWHSIGIYDSPEELLEIHGHYGATQIEWLD